MKVRGNGAFGSVTSVSFLLIANILIFMYALHAESLNYLLMESAKNSVVKTPEPKQCA